MLVLSADRNLKFVYFINIVFKINFFEQVLLPARFRGFVWRGSTVRCLESFYFSNGVKTWLKLKVFNEMKFFAWIVEK